ncbi:hypothetical protein CL6EHI_c00165 [Entamoeba histolytica]|uniref:Single tm domain protein n=1 Tax=Entamoeba histolytica TaxID=5759 RepID=A0A175JKK5_ENTHI|nr:hypothetical protein CL6EHI_c00165 [Entamoeba histolytica]
MKVLLIFLFTFVFTQAQTGNPTLIDVFLESGNKVKGSSYLNEAKKMAKNKVEMEQLIAKASASVSHMVHPSLPKRR